MVSEWAIKQNSATKKAELGYSADLADLGRLNWARCLIWRPFWNLGFWPRKGLGIPGIKGRLASHYTTNVIERGFGEVRRRTKVMGCLPNGKAINRIVYARFAMLNNKWARPTNFVKGMQQQTQLIAA